MNPETGKIERISGITDDGRNVFPPFKLMWTWLSVTRTDEWYLHFAVFFQKNENLRKRPFAVIHIGPFHFQTGWLFG